MQNLRKALSRLEEAFNGKVEIESLSRLYQSAPQYVTDQPVFLNAAALVRTSLEPLDFLHALKETEKYVGRKFGEGQIRWGPRPIDMDIIFFEDKNVIVDGDKLIVPHPRWQERDFVKAPLADLAPDQSGKTIPVGLNKHLITAKKIWEDQGGEKMMRNLSLDGSLESILPMGALDVWPWTGQSHVMGILNATPDSFSDGGKYFDTDKAIQRAVQMVQDGADIIDIGGQSTRPGAVQIDAEEEWSRVKPIIKAIRSESSIDKVPISIDTFYSNVAERAVEAGANIVNDVSGGNADKNMFKVVADMGVPYVLMHMRGNPRTMQSKDNCTYGDVCVDVAAALQASCNNAVESGIESWRIILDPGIGFAKSFEGNIDLVARLDELKTNMSVSFRNLPILMGPSRKKFLGLITGREDPNDREWATCAVSAICAMKGSNIIRAHNVKAVKDAVKIADSILSRSRN